MIQDQDINCEHCGIMRQVVTHMSSGRWRGRSGKKDEKGNKSAAYGGQTEEWRDWGRTLVKKNIQHETGRERRRNMALWRGRGRGTVHSKVWLHSRLSGSDSDGLLFFFFSVLPPD